MKHRRILMVGLVLATTLIAVIAGTEKSPELSVKGLPPSVVKTVPESGDTAVDPALKEIRVTFSKDMITDRMWSIGQVSKETFPEAPARFTTSLTSALASCL